MSTTMSTAAVIASYNQEAFIEESVLSIADQVDEVVVVDDSSPDSTFDVLQRITHPRVRVYRNGQNRGVSETFNRAASLTKADLLLIQGGDDRSIGGRASTQVEIMSDSRIALTYSQPSVISSAGLEAPDWLANDFFPVDSSAPHVARLLFENNYICAPSVALRRLDYAKLGGFRAGLDLLQDYDLWLRISEIGEIVESDRPLVAYRKHAANLSRDYVGSDSPKHRRLRAEQDWVRNSFLRDAADVTLDTLGAYVAHATPEFSALERDEKIAVLQLAHPDKTLTRAGVAFLVTLANRDDREHVFRRLGLTVDDLPRLMSRADHDNMDALGNVLAAGARDQAAFVLRPLIRSEGRGGSVLRAAVLGLRLLRGRRH